MIYLLWCTIRPYEFIKAHNLWMDRCKNKNNIITKVAVNTALQKKILKGYDVIITGDKRPGVCFPAYCLTSCLKALDNDIIVLASDDFIPPLNWDEYLIKQFKDFNGALFVRDGYQTPDIKDWCGIPAVTIPIMTYSCLKRLNMQIYHPEYYHMFSDIELYLNLKEMGYLKDNRINDKTTFEHRHYVTGKRKIDDTDKKCNAFWETDKKTFNKRKYYSLKDRLAVNMTVNFSCIKKINNNRISVLIPYKSDNGGLRDYIWSLVKKRYERFMPELEICEGICHDEPFNRARAVNNAAKKAKGNIFIITDADILFSPGIIKQIILNADFYPWIVPFSRGCKLTREATQKLINNGLFKNINVNPEDIECEFNTPGTFISAFKSEHFEKIGGMDERFKGWGGEDDALRISLLVICGQFLRLEGEVYHLWHPPSIVYNEYYKKNISLLKKYIEASKDENEMKKLIDGKKYD